MHAPAPLWETLPALIKFPFSSAQGSLSKLSALGILTKHFPHITSDLVSNYSYLGLTHKAPVPPASLLYLERARHSASGPLHWLFPLPECSSPMYVAYSLKSLPLGLLKSHLLRKAFPTTLSNTNSSSLPVPHLHLLCLIFPITMITF